MNILYGLLVAHILLLVLFMVNEIRLMIKRGTSFGDLLANFIHWFLRIAFGFICCYYLSYVAVTVLPMISIPRIAYAVAFFIIEALIFIDEK